MDITRFSLIAVLCIAGQAVNAADKDLTSPNEAEGNLKDKSEPTNADKNEGSGKLKRDLSIVGPIPTSYQGQAAGRTTYDGIQAGDLQLPRVDAFGGNGQPIKPRVQGFQGEQYQQSRAQIPTSPGFGGNGQPINQRVQGFRVEQYQQPRSQIPASPGFGGFATDSASDVFNFDGKEPVTYDGIFASDLMVPLPHVSRISTNQGNQPNAPISSFTIPSTSQQQQTVFHPQVPRQADSTVDGIFSGSLSLPTFSTAQQIYSPESFSGSKPELSDVAQFQTETPTERYNRLQAQYQATLEEYRISLARFRQQLQKYASLSSHKK